jgi:two-component system phosphate regulon sensor histidine kinase PhoR
VLRTTVEAIEEEVSSRLVEVLIRQVERLDRLSRELYDLATIESGQLELKLEPVPVRRVVADVVKDYEPEAERHGIRIHLEAEGSLRALCDRRGLYRVLSNLVDNAVKFNRLGGWVRLRAWQTSGELRLEVRDNGVGIPADELRAVLQRFYRRDRARTPGSGGLGMGLAIVKHLVQHMGGRMELDSREAAGTTVTIVFPAGG